MNSDKKLQRAGFGSIALGILAVVLCELPLLLTIVGLGSLGSAIAIIPLAQVEFAGLALAMAGAIMLIYLRVKRLRHQKELHT